MASQRPLPWICLSGVAVAAYTVHGAVPERMAVLPTLLTEVAVWTGLVATVALRNPQGMLRMSDMALSILGWMFFYFIKPAITWTQGWRFAFEGTTTVTLDTDIVARIQGLHIAFMMAFFFVYFVVAPRLDYEPPLSRKSASERGPAALAFVVLGLMPYLFNVVERVTTTGSILPSQSYGVSTYEAHDELLRARAMGGADYVVTQLFAKLWFYPVLALGLGYGVMLARFYAARRWLPIAVMFAQVPVLFLLGPGSRSYSVYPFIIALIVADLLAGPLPWRPVLAAVAAGVPIANFYAVVRGYQDLGLREAIASSREQIASLGDMVDTEDSAMLVKEAFCVQFADHTHVTSGASYFAESLLQLLPLQVVPEKAHFWSTANFLSQQFLGAAATRGAGMAGTAIGDGYLIGEELGLVVLAATFALIPSLMLRAVSDGRRAWGNILVLAFAVHAPQFARADLSTLVNAAVFSVLLPGGAMLAMENVMLHKESFWRRSLARVG